MTMVKILALEPFNGHQPGARVTVTEREAGNLIARGLAKMAAPVSNKMRQAPENKANPPSAAGGARRSSASPAARASRKPIAKPSAVGALTPALTGLSDESSQ